MDSETSRKEKRKNSIGKGIFFLLTQTYLPHGWFYFCHQRRRFRPDRPERAFVIEEFVEHALDCRFDVAGTAIAHVGVLVAGLYDRNAGLLTDPFRRNDPWIGLELRILRTERQDLESAVSHKRHAQVIERHDLFDMIGIHLSEIHRDVGASGMSYHSQMVIIRVRLDLLHFLD